MRTLATPNGTTGLAVVDVAMIGVRYSTDGRKASAGHEALLARVQAKDGHALVTTDQLDIGAGRAGDLTALFRLHLDVVNDRTDRDVLNRHSVAGLHIDGIGRGDHLDRKSQRLNASQ